MSHEGHVVSISLNAFCNFIGSANIPAGGAKTWHRLSLSSPSPVFLRARENTAGLGSYSAPQEETENHFFQHSVHLFCDGIW